VSTPIVIVMLLAAGLLIIGIANASLFAWSRGREDSFPVDRGDPDDLRLAKLGVDTMFGSLPVLVAMFLQAFSLADPLHLSEGQSAAAILATLAYLLVYFLVVRAKYGAFRLKVRRLLHSHSREG
jgi:hypothetical protein